MRKVEMDSRNSGINLAKLCPMVVKRGHLVCIIGIDGSGKTTLAKNLVTALKKEGADYRYVYARFLPKLLAPIWILRRRILCRSGSSKKKDDFTYRLSKKRLLNNRMIAWLHESSIILDYSIQLFFKVTLPLFGGTNLICDRYVFDTVLTDLAPDMNYQRERVGEILDIFFRWIPKPDLAVWIDVPENVSLARKTDIPDMDYLIERRALYRYLSSQQFFLQIDGTANEEFIKRTVLDAIKLKWVKVE